MKPATLTASQKLLLALSLPATLLFLYFLFKKDEEEENEEKEGDVFEKTSQVRVPRESVGHVIGLQGVQIKCIQERTGTRMSFSSEYGSENDRLLIISGPPEGVRQAEAIVQQIIDDHLPIVSDIIYIPRCSIKDIIGFNRETIRNLSVLSKTKIIINRAEVRSKEKEFIEVELRGTFPAIRSAKRLIMELVSKSQEKDAFTGKLSNVKDQYAVCYVSAIEHPGHFWIQKIDSNSDQLGVLAKDMTEFYNSCTYNDDGNSYKIGDMVASKLSFDNCWYRAEVRDIINDNLDLYFVDFGDSEIVGYEAARPLRENFLILPFQAIECSLANVKPSDSPDGTWSDTAVEKFERLTYVARWTPLMFKIVGHDNTSNDSTPYIELIDTNDDKDLNIAEELATLGLAKLCFHNDSSTHQEESLILECSASKS